MERTIISWNVANWLTVILMAAAGYGLLLVATKVLQPKGAVAASGGSF